ncbi:TerD family protein [Nocardia crassostreae]|uniref:TerD family protein n=1 Tax=Nocardia crassostreae TaxID=53428 RepID=UPI000AD5D98A|nr:TerD family protein [Nocardia crassostreae]
MVSNAFRDDRDASPEYLTVGLGWDPARGRWAPDIDLNVAAFLFSADSLVDVVYHEQLNSADGAVRHHGDSITGEGRGDNEIISVDLTRLSPAVTTVLFLVTCYTGQSFAEIRNAYCRVVDQVSSTEIARSELSGLPSSGLVLGALDRVSGWRFRPINQGIDARHPVEAAPLLTYYLV